MTNSEFDEFRERPPQGARLGFYKKITRISAKCVRMDYDNGFAIIYVETAVYIENTAENFVILDNGGWKTNTTKRHINDHLKGGYIRQKNFEWHMMNAAHEFVTNFGNIRGHAINSKFQIL